MQQQQTSLVLHPLEPLTAEEIQQAVAILREKQQLSEKARFVAVTLHEPPKSTVFSFKKGDPIHREAFVVVLDNAEETTYEAVVSLTDQKVKSWTPRPGIQPSVMLDEFLECEEIVKASQEYLDALKRRGIDNTDMVMVEPWSAGHFGVPEEEGRRILRTMSWLKMFSDDNGYAHPLEGIVTYVDMNKKEVIKVEDYGVLPIPPTDGNYTTKYVPVREDLKPLEVVQADGPSFTIEGHEIKWQKWSIRFGFNYREGLVLHQVTYDDQGKERPILYRASLSEMVVPYADPSPVHSRQNAFDVGEYGIGMLANSLRLGCDCLGEIRYFDAYLNNSKGEVVEIPNAICLHEEDYGILWKHTDWRNESVDVRRSRRLVLSSISTVGNYEYGFFWYFYQDGNIEFQVKLTGLLFTSAVAPGEKNKYGSLLAPQLLGFNHQHFFNMRMDFNLDGPNNTVYQIHTEAEPMGPENPFGNAFYTVTKPLRNELEAVGDLDLHNQKYWKFVNPNVKNHVGEPVGYRLVPGENCFPFAHEESSLMKRAGFIKHHMWVTPFDEKERYAAGDYPNQHAGGDGLPKWVQQDRNIENTDLVVWYTMGHHHIPRPEDWPVMPAAYIGFMLKPSGFFEKNPGLDVPPNPQKCNSMVKKGNAVGSSHSCH
ncbi:primary-amine oxidase [Brevibacillus dissolubilis]|uniref:primary-amine oxidase n=1 Tax=Brevibacillus dissolubilis TaxID=1844116 RepID=UPI0011171075|nr:primary-amine oxidase [Brevibacillus dissolubilis]